MKFIKIVFLVTCLFLTKTTIVAQSNSTTDTLKTITIKVKGVTCRGDLKTIAGNVEEIKGVKSCTPGKMGPTSSFIVSYNPIVADLKEIYKAIEATEGCENPNDRPYKVKQ